MTQLVSDAGGRDLGIAAFCVDQTSAALTAKEIEQFLL
jgi:hypothetical protein